MLQFRWRVSQDFGWGVAWYLRQLLWCHFIQVNIGFVSGKKTHVILVICQFYHKVKAKQTGFDPLSSLYRLQPWNCCCFSNIWRQTSKLNLAVVGASAVCLIIRLVKTQWVCSKAGHKRRCLVQDFDLFYILQVATFIIFFLHLSRLF